MKKCTPKIAFALAAAALALVVGSCDPEENAHLVVRNDLGGDVAELTLSGVDGTTGNLLGGRQIEDGADEFDVPVDVAPGKYRWHAVMASELSLAFDGADEIELFPGPNTVVLDQ
jgi:hypothetical protein